MANVENIKLSDLINKWMEVQKCNQNDDNTPLQIDAVNLTLLLKTLGFKLEHFDFENNFEKSHIDSLTIDIKCNKSGIKSNLSYDLVSCTCPAKPNGNNTSFWEVQATAPKMLSKFKNNIRDTSSNLLPEISENCSLVAKAMLTNLLDYYKANMRSVAEEKDFSIMKSPLKINTPQICVTSPGLTMCNPYATPPAEGKFITRVQLMRNEDFEEVKENEATVENAVATEEQTTKNEEKAEVKVENIVKKVEEVSAEAEKPAPEEKIEKETTPRNLTDAETDMKPPFSAPVTPTSKLELTDIDFAQSDLMKSLITSSPVEKVQDVWIQSNDRDINVIQALSNARQNIDTALLYMKLNMTHDISEGSSIITTPQNIVRKKMLTPKMPERANTMTTINRRSSLGTTITGRKSIGSTTPKLLSNVKAPTPITVVKKKLTGPAVPNPTKFVKSDTPRPIITSGFSKIKSTVSQPSSMVTTKKTTSTTTSSFKTVSSSTVATKPVAIKAIQKPAVIKK